MCSQLTVFGKTGPAGSSARSRVGEGIKLGTGSAPDRSTRALIVTGLVMKHRTVTRIIVQVKDNFMT